MEIKPLTFLFQAYWEISPKMAPRNLCVGTETLYFGTTEYAHFRFCLIYHRLDTAMALTRLKYHISCVMDYAELCCWRWCSSEGDCERCRLWDSWWRSLIPKMSNSLGCRRSGKLTLLIDVRPELPPLKASSWQPTVFTNSLLINLICSLFVSFSPAGQSFHLAGETAHTFFTHIYGSQMMCPPLAFL